MTKKHTRSVSNFKLRLHACMHQTKKRFVCVLLEVFYHAASAGAELLATNDATSRAHTSQGHGTKQATCQHNGHTGTRAPESPTASYPTTFSLNLARSILISLLDVHQCKKQQQQKKTRTSCCAVETKPQLVAPLSSGRAVGGRFSFVGLSRRRVQAKSGFWNGTSFRTQQTRARMEYP